MTESDGKPVERRNMKVADVRKQLEDYRRAKADEKERAELLAQEEDTRSICWTRTRSACGGSSERYPLQCWTITGAIWLAGQCFAAHVQFGLVFFICSLFLVMFLHLGVRAEGEMSAYSVFNPHCERLLGQVTSEHFERDMLMQGRTAD
ncbi:hypothetical protein M3Y99_00500700 [Aphelenchoides fujianensis]|nr:hypothetical protein M3Y99_00500700 [Aphelenchoides fujianensis]